jgi:hypothetical protein
MKKINPTQFQIMSLKGEVSPDISKGITSFEYRESILSTSVDLSVTFVDTGSRNSGGNSASVTESDDADVQGTEIVYFSFSDEDKNAIKFNTNTNALRIFDGKDVFSDTKKEVITYNLVTTEYLKKFYVKYYAGGNYEGKISDIVYQMLSKKLQTKKPIFLDETINQLNYNACINHTVQDAILDLAPKAIPNIPSAKGKTAGYFFYETADGFQFRSIDGLLSQKPKKKYIFTNAKGVPSGGYEKILAAPRYNSSVNALKLIRSGAYNSQLVTFDSDVDACNTTSLNKDDQDKGIKKAGKEFPMFDPEFDGPSYREFYTKDIASLPSGTTLEDQLARSDKENLVVTDVVNQSKMRYQQLFAIKVSFTIFADLTLRAGDIVECHFPEISSKVTQPISSKKSGLYMIVDLCHYISTNGPSYTILNLVRDSHGRRITP